MVWGLSTSFKSDYYFEHNLLSFPEFNKKMFNNYLTIFNKLEFQHNAVYFNFFDMVINSFIYTFGCSLISTFVPFLVAYLTARYEYRFSALINSLVIIVMMIPIVGNLPAQIALIKSMGMYDNNFSMIAVFIMQFHFLGMYYLVFYGMFKNIPDAYAEAAKIDGASNVKIMFNVMMPLGASTFLSVWLLRIIFYWNDYNTPYVFLQSQPTLSLMIMSFMQETNVFTIQVQMAGAMIFCLPILVLFLIFRKKLMGNVSIGGIKE